MASLVIRRIPHAFGDQLQLHHNEGYLQASSCTVGITQESVTGYKVMSNLLRVSIVLVWCVEHFMRHEARHSVLVVGYGIDVGTHHWKVKNSMR